jgi:phage terminase large subunit-like protein
LNYYHPYPRQLEFHHATARERLFLAGNQLGKTLAGSFEVAMHATGLYPDWWQGRRFEEPTVGWCCGVTGETVRDTVQKMLVGRPGSTGTGAIPKHCIADTVTARGIADLLDVIKVHHVSGGISLIGLKSYVSGRERCQGETLDYIWLDEECDAEIYTECLTRLNVGNKPIFMTMTPLLGVSEVVRRFLYEKSEDRHVTSMTISDVKHYSDEEKTRIENSYPAHEKEARTKGIPVLGSGRIFPIEESKIACDHRDIPPHWPRIMAWISASRIRLPRSKCAGIVIPMWSMSPRHTASASKARCITPQRCGHGGRAKSRSHGRGTAVGKLSRARAFLSWSSIAIRA